MRYIRHTQKVFGHTHERISSSNYHVLIVQERFVGSESYITTGTMYSTVNDGAIICVAPENFYAPRSTRVFKTAATSTSW